MDTAMRHPVLDGGIGAQLRLNNMWQDPESHLDGVPDVP